MFTTNADPIPGEAHSKHTTKSETKGKIMATAKGKGSTETPTHPAKGVSRPQAVVDTINFDDVAGSDELKSVAGPRNSKWVQTLNELYMGTEQGKVPRNEDGTLKFVRLGTFHNPGGARTQVKAFEDKGLDKTYEFKTVVKGHDSFLWARVREVTEAPAT